MNLTDNLNAKASRKGYRIEKVPETFFGFALPLWLTFEWLYISPKRTRYTAQALAQKFLLKRIRRAERRRKSIIKDLLLPNNIHPRNPYF